MRFTALFLILIFTSCRQNPSDKNSFVQAADTIAAKSTIKEADKMDSIFKLFQPNFNQQLHSPVNIEGKARGYWFFEGTAPVQLLDKNNTIISQGQIKAQGEWTTENFVDFKGKLTFTANVNEPKGYLIFRKANPSGLPENDEYYKIPVKLPSVKNE